MILKKVIAVFSFSLFLLGCGNDAAKQQQTKRIAKGNVKLGGVFHENETEYFRTLFPQNVTEVVGHRITNQVYEGLVRLNQADLSIEPSLAYRWDVNDSATQFTFHLRKNIFYHDDVCFLNGKGREMKAQDFVFCFEKLCTPDASNQGYWLFKDIVRGANEYFDAKEKKTNPIAHVAGVSAPDDSTLILNLQKPFAGFLYRLAMPFTAVFPKEAVDYYGSELREHCVGTGPFRVKRVLPDGGVFLVRNEHYWEHDSFGNQLPYLDGVRFSFIKDEKVEMLEFKKGNLDMKYRLPLDMVTQILDSNKNLTPDYKQFQLQTVKELSTQYYCFLNTDKVFGNVHVRRAFNYAIDRKKIVDYTLKGEGEIANSGIVPEGMSGFNYDAIKAFDYDVKKAKAELALAGYADGKSFPDVTLHINSGGGRNEKVAEAISSMLKESLNINVELSQSLWAQHTENSEMGRFEFWRYGWVADYPDSENFLNLYYGKNVPEKKDERAYLNPCRYKSAAFDKIFEKAMATPDPAERNRLYEQATQIGLDDAVTLCLFYPMNRRLLQSWVKNFPANGMEYRSFRKVWIDK
jgi:peptide/nickel transport system substrate-binding protein